MYKYKVTLPDDNRDVVEFESKYHISLIRPRLNADGATPIYFKDAKVMLNLVNELDIENDGQTYHLDK